MDIIKTIALILIASFLGTGLVVYHNKDTSITVDANIPVTIEVPFESSLGVIPVEFIATNATSTDPGNFGFLIGTSTNLTAFGSTTLAIYGSTTIQTAIDTEHAFRVINSASTTIFQVDTLNGLAAITGDLTISGTCTGCGSADPNVILTVSGGTTYLRASSTGNAWLFPDGFLSTASSTFSVGTTTIAARTSIGTSTPYTSSMLNIEIEEPTDHGLIIQGTVSQSAHLFMLRNNAGTRLFNVEDSGEIEVFHTATESGDHTLHLETDGAGFGNVVGVFSDFDPGALAAGQDATNILLTLDRRSTTGGDMHGIIVITTAGSADATALEVGVDLNVIRHNSGTFGDMDECTSTAGGDILSSCTSAGSDVTLFEADNHELVFGDAAQFTSIDVDLATDSNKNIDATFEYSTGNDTWTTFSPTDGTNGFQDSSRIAWELSDVSGWATGTSTRFFIRITRTRTGNISTPPVENLLQISNTNVFFWDLNAAVAVDILYASSTMLIDGLSTLTGFISTASSTIDSTLTVTGNVGIGTDNPDGTLHVFTASAGSISPTSSANDLTVENSADAGITILTPDSNISALNLGSPNRQTGAFFRWQNSTGILNIGTGDTDAIITFDTDLSIERMRIDSNGLVGIGTTSPYARLSVVGEVVMETFNATSTTATSTIAFGLTTDTLDVGSTATSTFGNGMRIEAGVLRLEAYTPNKATYVSSNGTLKVSDSGFSFSVSSSTMGTTTQWFSFQFPNAITLTEISCNTTLFGTSSIQFGEATRTVPNTLTNVIGEDSAVAMPCGSGFVNATTSFQNASIAADVPFWFFVPIPEVESLKPVTLNVSGKFTLDD